MIICKQKEQETETHLLSDDEVDELAVLLGINLKFVSVTGSTFEIAMPDTIHSAANSVEVKRTILTGF